MTRPVNASVYVERQMAEAVVHDHAIGTAVAFSASPAYPDSTNQDAAAVIDVDGERMVVVVADGAGGLPSGHKASALAVNALADSVRAAAAEGAPLRGAILDGFDLANRAILELGVGAATTLAVIQIEGRQLRTYHVGDSTVLVAGQRGKVKLLTMSHSPVGYQVEAGVLKPEEALHHADLNVVSNLVGSQDMRIEVGSSFTLSRYDTIVVGSDGLFDNLRIAEIIARVRTGPLTEAAKKLTRLCSERMNTTTEGLPSKPDDLTFVLYRAKPRYRPGSEEE